MKSPVTKTKWLTGEKVGWPCTRPSFRERPPASGLFGSTPRALCAVCVVAAGKESDLNEVRLLRNASSTRPPGIVRAAFESRRWVCRFCRLSPFFRMCLVASWPRRRSCARPSPPSTSRLSADASSTAVRGTGAREPSAQKDRLSKAHLAAGGSSPPARLWGGGLRSRVRRRFAGELQVSELERREQLASVFNDVVSSVVEQTFSLATGLPLTRAAAADALRQSGFMVRLSQPVKAQSLHAVLLLQQRLPQQIARRLMRLKLFLPPRRPPLDASQGAHTLEGACELRRFLLRECAAVIEREEPEGGLGGQGQRESSPVSSNPSDPTAAQAQEGNVDDAREKRECDLGEATSEARPADSDAAWVAVFRAPPSAFRDLEEKTRALGGSLAVLEWNCLGGQRAAEPRETTTTETSDPPPPSAPSPGLRRQTAGQKPSATEKADASPRSQRSPRAKGGGGALSQALDREAKLGGGRRGEEAAAAVADLALEEEAVWQDTRTRAQKKRGAGGRGAKKPMRNSTGASVSPSPVAGGATALDSSQRRRLTPPRRDDEQDARVAPPPPEAAAAAVSDEGSLVPETAGGRGVDKNSAAATQSPCCPGVGAGVFCRVCNSHFPDATVYRAHCKEGWHAANLKRSVAGMAPFSEEVWREVAADERILGFDAASELGGF